MSDDPHPERPESWMHASHPMDSLLLAMREEALLARYVVARRAQDKPLRRAVWKALAIRNLDRVRQMAAGHVFGSQRMEALNADDAGQEAWLRLVAMGETFRGSSMGELRKAIQKCVWHACMDFGRKDLAVKKRVAGSLDETWEDNEGVSRWQGALETEYERRADEAAEQEELASDRALVERAIDRIENENYRVVMQLTYLEHLEGEAIAERLGITPDNVYQRRRRGKQQMEKILRDLIDRPAPE